MRRCTSGNLRPRLRRMQAAPLRALPQSSSSSPGDRGSLQDGRRMNGESKGREFRSYHPKNARGRRTTMRTRRIWGGENPGGRDHASKRSIRRDSIATTCASIYLPGKNTIGGNQSFSDGRIEASGALKCRAAGVIKKLGALATLPFTVPFGRIEKHRKTRAVKLFDQLASMLARRLRSIVQKDGNPSNEPEFDAIDIELFMIKKGIHQNR
jgi:hypothetical protein